MPDVLSTALQLQHIILERLHNAPLDVRKGEDFRALKRTLGFTLSVITASAPEQGFALMRLCATWNDPDITWILRENSIRSVWQNLLRMRELCLTSWRNVLT